MGTKRVWLSAVVVAGLLLAVSAVSVVPVGASSSGRAPDRVSSHAHRRVCPVASGSEAQCQALVVTGADGVTPQATAAATGYGPADLAAAYALPAPPGGSWSWSGVTVGIVDPYDNPNAEADLAAYRASYGLPACTTANGCFKKVGQSASAKLPAPSVGWGQEIDLDIEMASAICPMCKIVLVEAKSNTFSDLGTAVNRAVSLGAKVVSNSYVGGESFFSAFIEGPYNHPGVAITAASGDSGYSSGFPASSPHVIAVGGTALSRDNSSRGWAETAWAGTGSWCSGVFAQPSWQNGLVTSDPSGKVCSKRTVVDVAAIADPGNGVAVYDSYGSTGGANWYKFGGTSVSAPIVGGLFARANDALGLSALPYPAARLYSAFRAANGSLWDITQGNNGACFPANADPAYLCNARAGYDGPTGVGTPNGLNAF